MADVDRDLPQMVDQRRKRRLRRGGWADDRRAPLESGDRDVVGTADVVRRQGHAVTVDIVGISRCLDHRDAIVPFERRVVDVA